MHLWRRACELREPRGNTCGDSSNHSVELVAFGVAGGRSQVTTLLVRSLVLKRGGYHRRVIPPPHTEGS